eukprot:TRINITY_DN1301_c0_g1_i2.p1 TRINITY_DN1301_c0_g1~~TRINITY_DN1301_c0_g1_i2.p1  ORF type:complete len:720 (-),score=109.68 TRINITY_DN1301_c0_g1_i2:530-2416(-)
MEMCRRLAGGRLSEMLGPGDNNAVLEIDRCARTFGWARLALQDWAHIQRDDPTEAAFLQAYCDGVNEIIQRHPQCWPIEFKLVGIKTPDVWLPVHSLAYARLMTWSLNYGWSGKIARARMIAELVKSVPCSIEEATKRVAEVDPIQTLESIAIPDGVTLGLFAGHEGGFFDFMTHPVATSPFAHLVDGSNAWAIAPELSETGQVLLANDTHLRWGTPNIMYYNGLKATSDHLNVAGVSLPGVPFVQIGHNEHVSWGITLAYLDAEDVFIERCTQTADGLRYFDPTIGESGDWAAPREIEETIQIKGRAPHVEKVLITRHGPVVSSLTGGHEQALPVSSDGYHYVLALQAGSMMATTAALKCQHLIAKASNYVEFAQAVSHQTNSYLNYVYADKDNNFGYVCSGAFPIRPKGALNWVLPVPGWETTYDWTTTIPAIEMPHTFNPKCGYVVSCNHRIVDDSYPYCLGIHFKMSSRANRVVELLRQKPKHSVEDFKRYQFDTISVVARDFAQWINKFPIPQGKSGQLVKSLAGWDGDMTATSRQAAIYGAFRMHLVREVLDPQMGAVCTDSSVYVHQHIILVCLSYASVVDEVGIRLFEPLITITVTIWKPSCACCHRPLQVCCVLLNPFD